MESVLSSQPIGVHSANSRGWPLNEGLTEIRQSPFLWGVFCMMLYLLLYESSRVYRVLLFYETWPKKHLLWLCLRVSTHAFGRITIIFYVKHIYHAWFIWRLTERNVQITGYAFRRLTTKNLHKWISLTLLCLTCALKLYSVQKLLRNTKIFKAFTRIAKSCFKRQKLLKSCRVQSRQAFT